MFIQNAWYVAAWPREIGDAPLARMICGEPVVLFRTGDGSIAALEDRCCHRHLPLSLGALVDGNLRCGYHGLLFNGEGRCIEVPVQKEIPPNARVRAFPIVEKWSMVWIWPGDPALADPATIPDLWWAGHKDWKLTTPDMAPLNCDYRLIADNVLDATHATYVHPTSIGAMSLTGVVPIVSRDGERVRVSRWIMNSPPPPAYIKAGRLTGNVDRWAAVEFRPPNYSVNFAGCVDAGFGGEGGDEASSPHRVEFVAISLPTPATRDTCHYFFAFARAFGHDDPEAEHFFNVGMVNVFREDYAILEAQQRLMNLKPNAPKVTLVTDRGPMMARRMVERLMEAEERARAAE